MYGPVAVFLLLGGEFGHLLDESGESAGGAEGLRLSKHALAGGEFTVVLLF